MPTQSLPSQLPLYRLNAETGGEPENVRVYSFKGDKSTHAEWFIPHRKDHYLIVFVRKGDGKHWIDTVPYTLKENTVYISRPDQVILKTESKGLWSTGIAFTDAFLALQENALLDKLPLIKNPQNIHELALEEEEVQFVEDILSKIELEYSHPSEWQQRMLGAFLGVLLTYLSRIFAERYQSNEVSPDKLLLRNFRIKVDDCFRELREVGDYAPLLNISANHLSEVVKIQSGMPAIKHIHERLMLEARRLLFHTDQSLKEIAYDLGFADASYFNRFFKREAGQTPAYFRSSIRKMYH